MLSELDAVVILNHWFDKQNRTVTQPQFDMLMESFKQCPYPLHLKVIAVNIISPNDVSQASMTFSMYNQFIVIGMLTA